MEDGFKGDARQACAVMRNEIGKFVHGNRILVFGALFIFFNLIIIASVLCFGDVFEEAGIPKIQVSMLFISMTQMTALIAAVLFSATSIVSEFQDRTALILLTRPIRRISIFAGKFAASYLVSAAFILAYYLIAVAFTLFYAGDLPSGIPESMAASLCFIFGMTGLSFAVSSVSKKGSTASIVTLVIYLIVLQTISGVALMLDLGDSWWCLTDASNAIVNALSGADIASPCAVMLAWGLVSAALSFILFRRRDF